MQKFSIRLLCLILFALPLMSFTKTPVNWQYSIRKISSTTYELHIIASIDKGWHIYSQIQPKDAIASPTKIDITRNALLSIKGTTTEKGNKELFTNKEVGISAWQYADKVEFVQVIVLKAPVKTNVSGNVSFQACTDEQCLPPQSIPFSLRIE